MNKIILIGRLTKDPDVRYTQGAQSTAIARYSLAVDRKFKKEGEPDADFINCVAFGRSGEFAEKYLRKGTKIAVVGRLQTGSYTNKDSQKVYTTDVIVEEHEFVESKASGGNSQQPTSKDGFMSIPDNFVDELPFD
jgi:single-strand DNA-binding protein